MLNEFSAPDSGRLDTNVDWTNATSAIGVYLTPANTCNLDEFNARSCNFLVRSEPSTAKPRKIATANFATDDESVAHQFVLSKGPCPAANTIPGVGASGARSLQSLGVLTGPGTMRSPGYTLAAGQSMTLPLGHPRTAYASSRITGRS